MQFDRHTLVLLVLRPDAPELTDEEAAELQDRHLAFRADLRDRGVLIAGGPRVDQDDKRLAASRSGRATPRRRAGSAAMTRRCRRAGSQSRCDLDGPGGKRPLREGVRATVIGRDGAGLTTAGVLA